MTIHDEDLCIQCQLRQNFKKSIQATASKTGGNPKRRWKDKTAKYILLDKLVQASLKKILEAVYEPVFYEEMMGFRPGRSCHQALRKLNQMIEGNKTSYVLDADIKGFFNHLSHEWIVKFIEARIKDPNIIRLVKRTLKSGIIEDYHYEETEESSGQGSVS